MRIFETQCRNENSLGTELLAFWTISEACVSPGSRLTMLNSLYNVGYPLAVLEEW